jgi:creatinine amidohydrolase
MKVSFGDLRWPEIKEVLEKPHALVLPIGAIEQHGRHLPVNFDVHSANFLAEEAAKKVSEENDIRVLVMPPIPYGDVAGRPAFEKPIPGSVTIGLDTLINLIRDIVRSLVQQGFNNILVLNGHVENMAPIQIALRKVNMEFKDPDLGLYATNHFLMAAEAWKEVWNLSFAGLGHAGEKETAVALNTQPDSVKIGEMYEGSHKSSLIPKYTQPFCGELVFYHSRIGGLRDSGMHLKDAGVGTEEAAAATKEAGKSLITATVEEIADILVRMVNSQGVTHEDRM